MECQDGSRTVALIPVGVMGKGDLAEDNECTEEQVRPSLDVKTDMALKAANSTNSTISD